MGTIYVNSSTGVDSNAGTVGAKLKSLSLALAQATGADTIDLIANATSPVRPTSFGSLSLLPAFSALNVQFRTSADYDIDGHGSYILAATDITHGKARDTLFNGNLDAWESERIPHKVAVGLSGIIATISNATPAVINTAAEVHGFDAGTVVRLTTTGELPVPLLPLTDYYVIAAGLTVIPPDATNALQVSLTAGGAAINTTTAGSGVHEISSTTVMRSIDVPDGVYAAELKRYNDSSGNASVSWKARLPANTPVTVTFNHKYTSAGAHRPKLFISRTIPTSNYNGAAWIDSGATYALDPAVTNSAAWATASMTFTTHPTVEGEYTFKLATFTTNKTVLVKNLTYTLNANSTYNWVQHAGNTYKVQGINILTSLDPFLYLLKSSVAAFNYGGVNALTYVKPTLLLADCLTKGESCFYDNTTATLYYTMTAAEAALGIGALHIEACKATVALSVENASTISLLNCFGGSSPVAFGNSGAIVNSANYRFGASGPYFAASPTVNDARSTLATSDFGFKMNTGANPVLNNCLSAYNWLGGYKAYGGGGYTANNCPSYKNGAGKTSAGIGYHNEGAGNVTLNFCLPWGNWTQGINAIGTGNLSLTNTIVHGNNQSDTDGITEFDVSASQLVTVTASHTTATSFSTAVDANLTAIMTANNNNSFNPYYVAPNAGDVRLGTGSLALTPGINIAGVTTDYRGKRRNNPPTRGIYEPGSGDPVSGRSARPSSLTRIAPVPLDLPIQPPVIKVPITKKFHPGHYMRLANPDYPVNYNNVADYAAIDMLVTTPGVTGIMVAFDWAELQSAANAWDFSKPQKILDRLNTLAGSALERADKKMVLFISDRSFSQNTPIPNYMLTPDTAVPGGAATNSNTTIVPGNGLIVNATANAGVHGGTFTIKCTSTVGGGTFSVVQPPVEPVLDNLPNAVAGTPYNQSGLAFTINVGTVAYKVGDTFTLRVLHGYSVYFESKVSAKQNGYVGMRWKSYYVAEYNKMTAAVAAQFDAQANFEGLADSESSLGVESSNDGYSASLYGSKLTEMLIAAQVKLVTSRVFWSMNSILGGNKTDEVDKICAAVLPFEVILGGPDVNPTSSGLVNTSTGAYLKYPPYHLGGGKTFCSMQHKSHNLVDWTMQELLDYAVDNLFTSYMFWNHEIPPGPYIYNFNDDKIVIADPANTLV